MLFENILPYSTLSSIRLVVDSCDEKNTTSKNCPQVFKLATTENIKLYVNEIDVCTRIISNPTFAQTHRHRWMTAYHTSIHPSKRPPTYVNKSKPNEARDQQQRGFQAEIK